MFPGSLNGNLRNAKNFWDYVSISDLDCSQSYERSQSSWFLRPVKKMKKKKCQGFLCIFKIKITDKGGKVREGLSGFSYIT